MTHPITAPYATIGIKEQNHWLYLFGLTITTHTTFVFINFHYARFENETQILQEGLVMLIK